jgi:NifU-like protein involved in Fe-S cluster formation
VYSERLRSLFHSREHAGSLPSATHFGEGGTRGQGPDIQLWVRCAEGRVEEARFRTFGCPAAVACAEAACRLGEGRTLSETTSLTAAEIAAEAGGAPQGKDHWPQLAAQAAAFLQPCGS